MKRHRWEVWRGLYLLATHKSRKDARRVARQEDGRTREIGT